jgi:V/A-type H+-transporting ATPase subunit K
MNRIAEFASKPIVLAALIGVLAGLVLAAPQAYAAPAAGGAAAGEGWGWAMMAAALATGLSSLGAGWAVARVGAAAIGALAEKPELLGRLLIFVGLAEGIAIYGLIVSVLVLNRLA